MYWETMPEWFWIIHYLFFLISLGTAVFSLFKRQRIKLSVFTMIVLVFLPVVGFFFSASASRSLTQTEYEFLFTQLQEGSGTAILIALGYLYLLFWLISFFIKSAPSFIGRTNSEVN
ncbi:hypothetical protein [Jeotgalibacillus sp. R-1-5s-1]|uniref:hypothetical protein n=1 Tax=Jeotgalibacillus sp. R-1-5s-1 TaxID=2555897 RepID=UPI00106A3DF2|nr:hypothetical protein [Jeotgalibacillus sp. R-1-5s-1]TFD93581.1 hypothetical protein E2491_14160 [Jeotgalibacillus sp. R-1-5s-1]